MADLSYTYVTLAGAEPTRVPADAEGDKVKPNERGLLSIKNGGTQAITVIIITPGRTRFGVEEPNVVFEVPAGGEKLTGPMLNDLVSDSVSGQIRLAYSDVTDVTVAAIYI